MAYIVQQADLDILKQSYKDIHIKVQLLNSKYMIIDEIQGYITQGSMSINADSDVRRVANITMIVNDDSMLIGPDKRIWIDKYIRIYYGFDYIRTGEIIWYDLGIYLFGDNTFTYDTATKSLVISCYDLMCKLNSFRGGQLQGLSTVIPVDSKIRDVMISVITQLGGFEKYLIEDTGKTVPYDLEYETGAAVYTVLKELGELYPGYEFFFDTDGTFVFQRIPTLDTDRPVLDYETLSPLIVRETISNSFGDIKNATEVWGKCLEEDRYTENVTNTGSQYNLTVDDFLYTDDGKIPSGTTIAFVANVDSGENPTIKFNDLEPFPLCDSAETPIAVGTLKAGKPYLVKFRKGYFLLQGQWQVHGVALLYSKERTEEEKAEDKKRENCENIIYLINEDNPFAIDKIGEEIRQVKSGGEYDLIYTDDLAMQRAEYDTWLTTRYADTLNLEMHIIPWLTVNQKIEYQSKMTKEVLEYVTKSISYDFAAGTMTVTAARFYPLYPFVVKI